MRIAHISDLHLLSLAGSRLLDFANKRWIGGMNLLVNRGRQHRTEVFEAMVDDVNALGVDHVACTGDITNLALEEEFRFARSHFDRFALGPTGVTVVPGNHDTYVARGTEHFRDHFGAFHAADDGWGGAGCDWPVVRVRGPVAIVGLSTSLATPWFTAYGVCGGDQLTRLREVLTDPRLDGKLRLVTIHHPPAGAGSASRVRGLRDRSALAEVLQSCGAELVLHGHEHRDLAHELDGPDRVRIPVRGIQSGTFESGRADLQARYRIYEIADRGAARPRVVSERLRLWDAVAQRFSDETHTVLAAG